MCKTFGVSKSGFYQWLKQTEPPEKQRQAILKGKIRNLHTHSKALYGSPKITALLCEAGIGISKRTVTPCMKEMDLRSITVKRYKTTTNSKHTLPV